MGYASGAAQFNILDPIRVAPHIYGRPETKKKPVLNYKDLRSWENLI